MINKLLTILALCASSVAFANTRPVLTGYDSSLTIPNANIQFGITYVYNSSDAFTLYNVTPPTPCTGSPFIPKSDPMFPIFVGEILNVRAAPANLVVFFKIVPESGQGNCKIVMIRSEY